MGFSAYKLVTKPFDWAAGLEDMGFDGWEIVSEGQQKITKESLPGFMDIINSMDIEITVHGPFSDLNPASVNDAIRDETIRQIRQCVELSADFSRIVVVHPGILSPLGSQMPDEAWTRNVDALRELCKHAGEHGVTLCLENMPNIEKLLCRTPYEIFGMAESVGDGIGMTFDVGHSNTMRNTAEFLKEKAKFAHVHIHDNHGIKDEHLELGKGTVDWGRVLPELKDFKGMAVVEARSLEEGRRSLEFIRKREHHP
ncbi:sugar phosphate isomerase/epimerase family protein [Methanocella paludicola]|uniref:sugar phosphate isomerase/epimerase family protein n=1 Tax=Methanocella paludicola TaxID=570267 RepID=UPI001E4F30AA|nr:sugar phosphate isomerase/epimerase family protein [Methanocella paludicola]